jgi:hypothetical protein
MRALLLLLALLPSAPAVVPSSGEPALPGRPAAINAIVGDRSWIERYGAPPTADAPEALRIETHLAWVEQQLRAAPVSHLSSARRVARAHLLDVLHAYTLAGAFPRHSAPQPIRRPRFVDDRGTHCAVAELVRASAGPALVEHVRAAHELDFIRDMHEPALIAWADANGMSMDELAMIQPTYDDGSGVEMPREERCTAHSPPTPLTREQVEPLLPTGPATGLVLACVPDRDGHWTASVRVRVDPGIVVRAHATIVAAGTTARDRALERCVRAQIENTFRVLFPPARYTLAARIEATRTFPIDAWSEAELDEALVAEPAVRLRETRASQLAQCMSTMPGSDPLRLPLLVELNASIRIRWEEMPPTAIEQHGEVGFCVERALTSRPISRVRRPRRLVTVDLMRDGSLQIVR